MLNSDEEVEHDYEKFLELFNFAKELPKTHELEKYHEFYSICISSSDNIHLIKNFNSNGDTYRIESEYPIYLSILTNKIRKK